MAVSRYKPPKKFLGVLLGLLAVLLSGCGSTTIFSAPAPLGAAVNVPYTTTASNSGSGLAALKGRDGSDAWHTATGEPSIIFQPVMVNGIIYTEGGTRKPGQNTLVAVRAGNGDILWRFQAPIWDFAMATDGATVLVAAGTHGLYALDAKTGATRWQRNETARAPLYVRDGVAVVTLTDAQGQDAHLAVYREDDGGPLWQLTYAPDVAINHTAIYTAASNEILAYAPQTGKELWHSETAGNIIAINNHSVTLSDGNNVVSLDAATGATRWNVPVAFDGWMGSAQSPTLVYGGHQDTVLAVRVSDGSQSWYSEFPGYIIVQISEEQGVVFAMLAGGAESSKPARVAALDGTTGRVYWQRDILQISDLVSNQPG